MLHRRASPAVAGSYVIGACTGATLTAAGSLVVSGLLSPIPASLRVTLGVSLLVLLAMHALGLLCLTLPQRRRQIDREVFAQPASRAAFTFAFELGTGLRTYVTSAAPYGVLAVLLLGPNANVDTALIHALCAAIGFGIGRSLVVASHTLTSRVAVDHPPIWYRFATLLSLSASGLALAHLASAVG